MALHAAIVLIRFKRLFLLSMTGRNSAGTLLNFAPRGNPLDFLVQLDAEGHPRQFDAGLLLYGIMSARKWSVDPKKVANALNCSLNLQNIVWRSDMKKVVIAASLIALVACAKEPDAVEPAKIETGAYMAMSCKTLNAKQVEGETAVASLSAKQKNAATNDALGVFLLGLPLASMSGNDNETQLSIAKGQLNAIKIARAQKGCS